MPIYEYECQDKECGERTEVIVTSYQDREKVIECSECGSKAVSVYSRSSAHFKGSGWTPKHF